MEKFTLIQTLNRLADDFEESFIIRAVELPESHMENIELIKRIICEAATYPRQNTPEFEVWISQVRELTHDFSWRDQFNEGKTPEQAFWALAAIANAHNIDTLPPQFNSDAYLIRMLIRIEEAMQKAAGLNEVLYLERLATVANSIILVMKS